MSHSGGNATSGALCLEGLRSCVATSPRGGHVRRGGEQGACCLSVALGGSWSLQLGPTLLPPGSVRGCICEVHLGIGPWLRLGPG